MQSIYSSMALNAPQDFGQPFVLEDFIIVEQPVTASSVPLCAVCHKVTEQMQRCGGCKNLTYCSKVCQVSTLMCNIFVDDSLTFNRHVTGNNTNYYARASLNAPARALITTARSSSQPTGLARNLFGSSTVQMELLSIL
jgi:hypothetical protein